MDHLVIEGMKPWDGRYEFDVDASALTTREWGWIKRYSGYLPLTISDGFAGGDPELYACFAIVALHRAGRIDQGDVDDLIDRLADAPFGSVIRLEGDPAGEKEGDDAGPPAPSSNGNASTSGPDSTTSSDPSGDPSSSSGTPASAISGWPPARSAT